MLGVEAGLSPGLCVEQVGLNSRRVCTVHTDLKLLGWSHFVSTS